MNKLIKKFSLFHYNIGFFPCLEDSLLHGEICIHWMNHSYKDRFFADPFILDVTEDEIKVLVEDFPYSEWKGNISLLTIERDSYALKRKKTLLELDTHLSFPFICRTETGIYVIPENSESGKLTAYRYEAETETLHAAATLVEQPVVDPVILSQDGRNILFGSLKGRKENSDLYAWQSDDLLGHYVPVSDTPLKSDNASGRRGGDFFLLNGGRYSATQSCVNSYGEALNICKVEELVGDKLIEKTVRTLYPDRSYREGVHTLNLHNGLCVVDGLTYLFRPFEKLLISIQNR